MNQKYIITGAPGTGKSSIINALIAKGYDCAQEISRTIITEQLASGGNMLPWKNQIAFENHIAALREEQHLKAPEGKYCFFDRSSIDCIAYLKVSNLTTTAKITEITQRCKFNKKVFITPFWKEIYINDGERLESIKAAIKIENSLIRTYKNLNYTLIEVPKTTIKERVAFILSKI